MLKKLLSANIVILALFLSACGGGGRASVCPDGEEADTLHFNYATNIEILKYNDFTRVDLRNPWDTLKTLHTYLLVDKRKPLPDNLPDGTVVRTPIGKSVVYSAVHCSLLNDLGALSSIAGVCDFKYINLQAIKDRKEKNAVADCGESMNPDMERIIDLHPDAILLSPFENSGGYGRVEKLNIPLIECADYMETSPLGRAEWMRFYGLLFGVAPQADSLFAEVEANYRQLKQRAALSSTSLSIISELKSGSAWYVPGGHSTVARLFRDACGRYAFADDTHSGSIPLAFETVFDKAGDADVWTIKYNRDRDITYADLESDYAGYTGFKAFKERNIYGCNTGKVPFYEETPFRPDYLLADFIQMLHPEIGDLGGLRYFCKLK